MWLHSLLASWKAGLSRRRRPQPRPARRGIRPVLEHLEDRALPSSYSASSVSALTADISAANKAGGANTIALSAPTTSPYVGGMLSIAANDNLTIVGNGDTIERNTASGTKPFRLFDVASGGSLTLQNMTLKNGFAISSYYYGGLDSLGGIGPAQGGAIYNLGALTLKGVTVADNQAIAGTNASEGASAYGGAIWSNGSLTLENGTLFEGNSAQGGSPEQHGDSGLGGSAFGGAVYVAGGTANISNTTFTGNSVTGGLALGDAFGGAIYVAAGQVTLTNSTVINNGAGFPTFSVLGDAAWGGGVYIAGGTVSLSGDTVDSNYVSNGQSGVGGGLFILGGTVTVSNTTVQANVASNVYDTAGGGGICIASWGGATVYLDPFTVANAINNTDSSGTNGSTGDIDGTYILT